MKSHKTATMQRKLPLNVTATYDVDATRYKRKCVHIAVATRNTSACDVDATLNALCGHRGHRRLAWLECSDLRGKGGSCTEHGAMTQDYAASASRASPIQSMFGVRAFLPPNLP